MRILSIGVNIMGAEEINIMNDSTFLDADIVCINFEKVIIQSLTSIAENFMDSKGNIKTAKEEELNKNKDYFEKLLERRKKDGIEFLENNGVIVLETTPLREEYFKKLITKNSDRLNMSRFGNIMIERKSGKNVELLDSSLNELFSEVISGFKYQTILKSGIETPLLKIKNTNHIVGGYNKYGNGILIFLPKFIHSKRKKEHPSKENYYNFIISLVDYIRKKEKNESISMLPIPKNFYLNESLYKRYTFNEDEKNQIFKILFYKGSIDAYCKTCKKESVLISVDNFPQEGRRVPRPSNFPLSIMDSKELDFSFFDVFQKTIEKKFSCTRCNTKFSFFFEISKEIISTEEQNYFIKKIGQSCSVADFQNPSISKYRRLLGKELYNEFNKGIGLFSHGVGIGSFVYLRRIVEKFVIKEAYEIESKKKGFDKELYKRNRVKERIDMLKDSIPEFFVKNKVLYGILSKGIHELSEDDCLRIFPLIKTSLEFILDDLKSKKESEEKRELLTKQLNSIGNKMS